MMSAVAAAKAPQDLAAGSRQFSLGRVPSRVSAVPTGVGGAVWLGMFTLVGLVGGFLTWALLAPLNSAVLGQGILVVETNRRDVQHLEGGIIREIHVRDGDVVNAGDRVDHARPDPRSGGASNRARADGRQPSPAGPAARGNEGG